MNRPITDQECAWLVRGLSELETGEELPFDEPVDPSFYLAQLDDLRVVYKCPCGDRNCHTIAFHRNGSGFSQLIVNYHTQDGRLLLIFDDEANELTELEII